MSVKHKVKVKDGGLKEINLTRSAAIKAFCTECLGWTMHPKDCISYTCALYPFRGKTNSTLK
tara:strand:- start:298 stop:483 length:186 start_codon:yes stop_codon:yes gene_type:complete